MDDGKAAFAFARRASRGKPCAHLPVEGGRTHLRLSAKEGKFAKIGEEYNIKYCIFAENMVQYIRDFRRRGYLAADFGVMAMITARVRSHAKVNLTLEIVGRDGGFHLLDSLFLNFISYYNAYKNNKYLLKKS